MTGTAHAPVCRGCLTGCPAALVTPLWQRMTGMAHMPVAHDCSGQGEPPYVTVL